MTEPQDFADIIKIMDRYFDGLYNANTEILSQVFHPDARYVNMNEGDYMNKSLAQYFELIGKRVPPAESGEVRKDHIVSIELGDARMAFVHATMSMTGRKYLDFLTLTNDHNGWRIMSKIFTYKVINRET